MITFFTILLILICVNAAMMLVSLYSANKTSIKTKRGITEATISKIYPLDLFANDYKKAV